MRLVQCSMINRMIFALGRDHDFVLLLRELILLLHVPLPWVYTEALLVCPCYNVLISKVRLEPFRNIHGNSKFPSLYMKLCTHV